MRTVEAYTITETDADITLTANTADVLSEILNYRVPDKSAIKIKAGSRIYLYIANVSGAAQITAGTVKLFKASVDKETHKTRILVASPDELDAGGTPEDREKQYTIKRDYVVGPKEYLLLEANVASVCGTTLTKFRLDCKKIIEWTL